MRKCLWEDERRLSELSPITHWVFLVWKHHLCVSAYDVDNMVMSAKDCGTPTSKSVAFHFTNVTLLPPLPPEVAHERVPGRQTKLYLRGFATHPIHPLLVRFHPGVLYIFEEPTNCTLLKLT